MSDKDKPSWIDKFKRSVKDNINYAGYVIKHKANIVKPMVEMNLPYSQALSHDISKFRPSEFSPYRNWFFGPEGRTAVEPSSKVFNTWRHAVQKHYKDNPHHWMKVGKDPAKVPIETKMESVADWYSVGKTLRGSRGYPTFKNWYIKRRDKLPVDNTTKTIIDYNLGLLKTSNVKDTVDAAKAALTQLSDSTGVTEAGKKFMSSKAMKVIAKLDEQVSNSRVGKELKLWNEYGKTFYPKAHKVSKILLNPAVPTVIPGLGEVPMVATTAMGGATRMLAAAHMHHPKAFTRIMESVSAIK